MNSWLIEKNLRSVRQRWKWLVFGRRIGIAGSALCLIWFLIQLGAYGGVLTRLWIYNLLVALMFLVGLVTLMIALVVTFASREKRSWIGNALERGCPPLMDRVNTLIYFEENPRLLRSFTLRNRIEQQAETVIGTQKTASPFSPEQTLIQLGIFVLLLAWCT